MDLVLRVKTRWKDPSPRIRQIMNERDEKNQNEALEAYTYNDMDALYSLTEAGERYIREGR